MAVKAIVLGPLATNCYLVTAPGGNSAAVIDPGDDAPAVLAAIGDEGLSVGAIICTHGHYDHVGAIPELVAATTAPVYIHARDAAMLSDSTANLSAIFSGSPTVFTTGHIAVAEGDLIEVDGLELKVIDTPGHTPGGMSLLGPEGLFCGDALFAGSIGRTDLPGGDFDTLMMSIHAKLLTLPDDTVVYPGHGPVTTIGAEKETNPFF